MQKCWYPDGPLAYCVDVCVSPSGHHSVQRTWSLRDHLLWPNDPVREQERSEDLPLREWGDAKCAKRGGGK